MTYPLVGADLDLALDVLADVPPQVAFHLQVGVDPTAELGHLLVGQVAHPGVRVDPRGRAHLAGGGPTNPVDVGEGDLQPLFPRDVHSSDTGHSRCLALPLLVARVGADDQHPPVTADHLAVLADRFDAGTDFHGLYYLGY